jgi:tetratricopeptide (TPR) repeat protein/TolB-like protein
MGRVFRARDTSLKRDVAIKVLSPRLEGQPRFTEHLLREARAVAQLHHPHIAGVYDVVDDGGSLCIVMEYLRGETLAARLRRGPLTGAEGVRYAREITGALAHAHAQGIVHCDLKPGNIFLTEDAGAKVLDFGLARMPGRPPDIPSEGIGVSPALIGNRAGTPGYMSPEQKRGLPLDHRSDIYSLGVVLREMVTGATADHGQTAPATSGGAWAPIIDRALAYSPDERFQSAAELEAALRAVESRRTWSWSHPAVLGAAVLAVLVAGAAAFLRPSTRGAAPGPPPVVAVSRFMSSPGDVSLSYLAAGLSDIVANDLAASNAVVVARSDRIVGSAEDAAALARELGAGVVILGRVERRNADIAIELRPFTAGDGSLGDATSFQRPANDLIAIRGSLRAAVAGQVGLSGERMLNTGGADDRLLPKAMDTFEDYAQARWFLERYDVETNVHHAMAILQKVVAREPGFAPAHAALGEATWRKWLATKDRKWSDEAVQHALEALRLSPDLPEVRYAVAVIYQGTGRGAEALSEMEHVARQRPLNDDARRLLGRLYADAGRVDDGLAAERAAIAIRPGYWQNHSALGNAAFRAGRYEEAITAFTRYCELRPDSASAHQRLGTAYHAAGDLDAALRSYQRALEISPNAKAYSNVGTLQFDAGRYAEAIKAYERAVELEPRNPSLHRNLADAMAHAGDSREATTEYAKAIALATDVLRVNPKDALTLSVKAVGLARTARLSEGLATSNAALQLAPNDPDVLYENALILTLAGRKGEALDALTRAVAAGYSRQRLQRERDMSPLAAEPGFRRLVGNGSSDS